MRRSLSVLAGLLLAFNLLPVTGSAEPPLRAVNIAMEDQFKTRHETGAMRGDVVVLVYAERKGGEAAHEVGRRLHVHYHPTAEQVPASEWSRQPVVGIPGMPPGVRPSDVRCIAVASLPEIPKALQPVARAQLRKESPHVPVWLDFDGRLEHLFGVATGKPNVVLINTVGEVHSVLSGTVDATRFREIVATIDGLRIQQAAALRTASTPALVR